MEQSSTRRVAIMMPAEYGYNRQVLRGVSRFLYEGRPWIMNFRNSPSIVKASDLLELQHMDGLIIHLADVRSVDAFSELKIPIVNVSSALLSTPFPRVGGDDVQVGRLGARHFIDKGFRECAFIGYGRHLYSINRAKGFSEELAKAGCTCHIYDDTDEKVHRDPRAVERWLQKLPKPIAVMACSDRRALQLAMVCYQSHIRIPDEVALLGVDNDDLTCELAYPRLSSVAIAGERIGYEAASLLNRLMNGESPPSNAVELPPLGVVARQSTDILAVGDPDVSAALQIIKKRAHEPMSVEDLLAEVPVSRRVLERRFRQLLGHSPSEEIRRQRVELAKELLAKTELRVSDIAERCGFASPQRFIVTFRTLTRLTPQAYRLNVPGHAKRNGVKHS